MPPATTAALTLNNDVTMPALGLGVFQSPPEETIAAVESALRDGYRLIDTAAAYDNEREVGEGIRRSGVDRDEIFVTTKLWISDYGYDAARVGFEASLRRLGRRPRLLLPAAPAGSDLFRGHDRRLPSRRDVPRRRPGSRHRGLELQPGAPPSAERRHQCRSGGQPGRAASVLHAVRTAGSTPSSASPLRRGRRSGASCLRARRRRVPRPADRPGRHRPRGQVRQDPGAGRPALARRARFLRDPQVGQAAPHRRELRRLRLRADRRGGRGDRRAQGVRGGPDPAQLSMDTYPKVVDNS